MSIFVHRCKVFVSNVSASLAVGSCVMWKALLGNGVQCWSDGRITNDARSRTLSSALNYSGAVIISVDLLEF